MHDSCPSALGSFHSFYRNYVHFYLCLAICIVGSVFNIINIVVFTRKNMVSPTNVVLTFLAVADLVYLLSYIPTAYGLPESYPYDWWWISEVEYLAVLISIWMTLVLAVWRYLAVVYPLNARNWCNMKITYRTVVTIYVLCSLMKFLSIMLKKTSPQLCKEFRRHIFTWYICLIPVIALPTLTLGQVYALWKAKKDRQKLRPSFVQQNAKDLDIENEMNRSTLMLLFVLFLFLIATMPYTIYYLLEYVIQDIGSTSYWHCFFKFHTFYIMLAKLNAASNSLVYYLMSCQFRETCRILFNCNRFAAVRNVLRNKGRDESKTATTSV